MISSGVMRRKWTIASTVSNHRTLHIDANLYFSIPDEWAMRGIQSWKAVANYCFGWDIKVRL